jgi:hypothetical protein
VVEHPAIGGKVLKLEKSSLKKEMSEMLYSYTNLCSSVVEHPAIGGKVLEAGKKFL